MMEHLRRILRDNSLIKMVLSKPLSRQMEKVTIVPLLIKNKPIFQFTVIIQNKALHHNLNPGEAENSIMDYLLQFKEAHIFTQDADYLGLQSKKKEWKWIESKPTKKKENLTHNRLKKYLLEESSQGAFWKVLGIANASGKIKPDKQAKFRQVNRFLEILKDAISHIPKENTLSIVDFGCGKAYLTFALYHYLVNVMQRNIKVIGIDLKQDVVLHLEEIRQNLGYMNLQFFEGNIATFPLGKDKIDLVISLHACDTATDAVLNRALQVEAEVILAVPCCQHELYSKIQQPLLAPILKHGILKERFSALATDALRSLKLEEAGYAVQVIEFIDTEHTPKNIMLKAIKAPNKNRNHEDYKLFYSFLLQK